MAEQIFAGRHTAEMEDGFVVFLIGARINSWRKLMKFRWIGEANNKMFQVLEQHPETGYLGGEAFIRFPSMASINVTYWRSYEDLERFAHSKDEPHLEAWRDFNKLIGNDGSFGIWHETYIIPPGHYEAVYNNMPVFGLAKAGRHTLLNSRQQTARARLKGEGLQPLVAPPTN